METRVETQMGEESRGGGESWLEMGKEVGRGAVAEREEGKSQPSNLSLPSCLPPSRTPSNPAYQVTRWRGWWGLGAKFSNWPASWEFVWEAPVCSQGHGPCVSLLGGSFSAQSWLIVHPLCSLSGENHTRLFHIDTRGPWGCLVTLEALTIRGWGPGTVFYH